MKHYKKILYLFICFLALGVSVFSFWGCGESSAEKYKSKDKAVKQVVANVSETTNNPKKEATETKVKNAEATKNIKQQEKVKAEVKSASKGKVLPGSNEKNKKSNELKGVKINTIKSNEKKDTFTLIISKDVKGYKGKQGKIIEQKELKVDNNKTIMTYLRDNFDMEDNGGFIYRIGQYTSVYPIPASEMTEEQKQNKIMGIDWFIYVNGKKNPEGANDMYVKAGQKIMIDYHEWDKREVSANQ